MTPGNVDLAIRSDGILILSHDEGYEEIFRKEDVIRITLQGPSVILWLPTGYISVNCPNREAARAFYDGAFAGIFPAP